MPLPAGAPRPITLALTPFEVAAACRHLPGLVFFDTSLESAGAEQLSIIAAQPREIWCGNSDADWARLRGELARRQTEPGFDHGLPHGFAAGFVEYEGAFCFGIYEQVLFFHHGEARWYALGDLAAQLRLEANPIPEENPVHFASTMTRETYCALVAEAQEYIAAGDIYQVNLAHRFGADWSGDAFTFYAALRHYSPAPYAAFLQLGEKTILSASPESFLKMSGRAIRTRPIKGTRPRRAEMNADALSAYDLRTSAKERAELVMITDLERNDLGRICEYGTVSVAELLKLERFEQVFHLVSTVEGQLRREVTHADALRACFPGGSITGAPKKRAREIIAQLEPEPRGLYTGAIGWLGFNEESQFNIAIRTVVIEREHAHFHVGAGIVADSCPAKEWQETLDKAAGILLAADRHAARVHAAR